MMIAFECAAIRRAAPAQTLRSEWRRGNRGAGKRTRRGGGEGGRDVGMRERVVEWRQKKISFPAVWDGWREEQMRRRRQTSVRKRQHDDAGHCGGCTGGACEARTPMAGQCGKHPRGTRRASRGGSSGREKRRGRAKRGEEEKQRGDAGGGVGVAREESSSWKPSFSCAFSLPAPCRRRWSTVAP